MDTTLHKITSDKSILYKVLLPDSYLSRYYVGSLVSPLEPCSISGYLACTRGFHLPMICFIMNVLLEPKLVITATETKYLHAA